MSPNFILSTLHPQIYHSAIVSQKLGALASLGAGFTAYSRATENNFPFVVMNDFQQRASTARALSSALAVESCLLVKPDEVQQWNAFSTNNSGWYEEGFTYQDQLGYPPQERRTIEELLSISENITYETGIANKMFRQRQDQNRTRIPVPPLHNEGLSCPVWQSSPVRGTNFINYDRYAGFQRPTLELIRTSRKLAIHGFFAGQPGDVTFFKSLLSVSAGKDVYYKGQPFSQVYLPIFNNFTTDREVVGAITTTMDWSSYFEDIISSSENGEIVFLKNECFGNHSYLIDGNGVTPLGEGDYGNPDYNKYKKTTQFGDLRVQDGTPQGIEIDQGPDGCFYELTVYPSDALYDEFHTNLPILVTASIGAVFVSLNWVLVSLLFTETF